MYSIEHIITRKWYVLLIQTCEKVSDSGVYSELLDKKNNGIGEGALIHSVFVYQFLKIFQFNKFQTKWSRFSEKTDDLGVI